jgi:hypothetical protein
VTLQILKMGLQVGQIFDRYDIEKDIGYQSKATFDVLNTLQVLRAVQHNKRGSFQ